MTRHSIIHLTQYLSLFLLVVITASCLNAPSRPIGVPEGFTVTAHSGAYQTPDNSLEYINAALEHQADVIEFDVRLRPDGTLAMSHDAIKSNEDGVPIRDVLMMIKGSSSHINLDIKQTEALKSLSALVRETGMLPQVFLTGIEPGGVETVKRDFPEVGYFINCSPSTTRIQEKAYQDSLITSLSSLGGVGVNCNFNYASSTLASLLHENGFLLSVWTVNDKADMERMLLLKPDNITSRNPLELISLINQQKP